jgi:hypothetical protein
LKDSDFFLKRQANEILPQRFRKVGQLLGIFESFNFYFLEMLSQFFLLISAASQCSQQYRGSGSVCIWAPDPVVTGPAPDPSIIKQK